MSTVITTNQLTKHFGKIKAVQALDLHIESGQVFGILGPNGSGKTTTLGMMLGVISPTSGSYSWFESGDGNQLRKRIGAILEHPIFYPFHSAVHNLRIAARIKDVSNPEIDRLLEMVGLYERRNDPFKTYSLGMKQRLAIAAAMISDPDLLIFDEPTNGLDPEGIADIRNLIRSIAESGKTILLASHLLDEVQKVCTNFAVLRSGVKIFQGSVKEVLEHHKRIEVRAADNELLRRELSGIPQIDEIRLLDDILVAELNDDLEPQRLNQLLFDKGIVVSHLAAVSSSLEEEFLAILKEDV